MQVSLSCHSLQPLSQSGHMVVLELQTSFLKDLKFKSLQRKDVLYEDTARNLQEGWVFVVGDAIEEDNDPDDSRWD